MNRRLTALAFAAMVAATPAGANSLVDSHMSRSMELMLLERAYGAGYDNGQQLRRDQVLALQDSTLRVEASVNDLNRRVDDIQTVNAELTESAHYVIDQAESIAGKRIAVAETEGALHDRVTDLSSDTRQLRAENRRLERSVGSLRVADASVVQAARETNATSARVLTQAEDVSGRKIRLAEAEAAKQLEAANERAKQVLAKAKQTAHVSQGNYERVMTERVNCNLRNALVVEAFECVTPTGWEWDLEVDDDRFTNAFISFTSDRPRAAAIQDLLTKIRRQTENPKIDLRANFYPRLVSKRTGEPTPTVLFVEEKF